MVLYRANIRPQSSFASALQSDTFFGAFCWSYRYLFGEERLESLLRESMEDEPRIVFSNAFPAGCLPLPMGVYDPERKRYGEIEKAEAKQAYQQNKKYKKCSLIEKSAFRNIQQGDWGGYSDSLEREKAEQISTTHNMVKRDYEEDVKSKQSGNLFASNESFLKPEDSLDVYILTSLDEEILQRTLSLMLELGIGADKSVGKGSFALLSLEEEKDLLSAEDANAYMALSNFIPAADDPTDGAYRTLVKYGRLDREYAAGEYPFKKPLLFIQAGAMFRTEKVCVYYGSMVENIAIRSGVVVNACTIAVPVHIPGEDMNKL